MILLKLFYFMIFSSCQLKKIGAQGNLGYVRLAVLTLTAGIEIFGPKKKLFSFTFMTLIKKFYFRNFSSCPLKNAAKRSRQHARIKRRLSSNERTHTRRDAPTIYPNEQTHKFFLTNGRNRQSHI